LSQLSDWNQMKQKNIPFNVFSMQMSHLEGKERWKC
jgi:hypothetical protein